MRLLLMVAVLVVFMPLPALALSPSGQKPTLIELEVIPDALDVDGLIILLFSLGAVWALWLAGKNNAWYRGGFWTVSVGTFVMGVNIAFGAMWEEFSLDNPVAENLEDVIEIVGMAFMALGGVLVWLRSKDKKL